MLKKLRKIFIPHESNSFHPHSTRAKSILSYALVLILLNYLILPAFGITYQKALATSEIFPEELISLANHDRIESGLSDLKENSLLSKAAELKGKDMLQKQYWSHYGPNKESPWQFIKEVGYSYVYAGENLAKDFYKNIDVHNAWMQSKTHKENILNPNFKDIGIAIVTGELEDYETTIIIVLFGSQFTDSVAGNSKEMDSNPEIIKPVSGSTLSANNIEIEGKAEFGDTLKIFSNNKLIGELPKSNAAFTINIELLEKENELYIKSKDSKTGAESQKSNTVTLSINSNSTFKPEDTSLLSAKNDLPDSNGFFGKIRSFSLTKKINSAVILVVSFLVSLDLITLLIKGIKREHTSHHSLHLVLILITVISVITV